MMSGAAGLDSLATACSGALSAVAAKVIIYPLDWMKLRLSVKRPDESASSIVMGALKTHGIGGVYMVRRFLEPICVTRSRLSSLSARTSRSLIVTRR